MKSIRNSSTQSADDIAAPTSEELPTPAGPRGPENEKPTQPVRDVQRDDTGRTTGGTGLDQDVAGQEEWLKALYAENSRSLLSYAMRLTGDRFLAEDVVQETLLRAWNNPESVRKTGAAMRGWLFTVAKHIVIDRARARAARPQEVATPEHREPAIDDHSEPVIDGLAMYHALAQLSADHRAVLVEVYYRGKTIAEAAATLGVAEGTARSRTFYALRRLRDVINPSDGQETEPADVRA